MAPRVADDAGAGHRGELMGQVLQPYSMRALIVTAALARASRFEGEHR
jgi:hypothetical protein